ncbi:F-box LRR-repeat 4 [Brachionus plicatilis]|uniref:F-box LRR-repeat 4 n=1 Tax=Brachionus plicatilis TaxID=10195 RepID=A0A3M7Q3H9_BRAPC|nr:F-box LRR-repeat 4 [Brachionus plicatilis]
MLMKSKLLENEILILYCCIFIKKLNAETFFLLSKLFLFEGNPQAVNNIVQVFTKTFYFSEIFENSCSQLTVLHMENCQFLNANILSLISDNCSKLVSLNVACCLNISPSDQNGFAPIANLFNLEVLNLYRTLIDGQQMVKIVQSCKNLKSLNLGACMKINEFDEVMTTLAENCDKIESLDLWRAYSLTSMGLRNRSVISFEWLKIMLEKCVQMRKLFLTSLRVSDNELYLISQKGLQIEQLDILGSRSISKETVELVLKNCKKLKLFDISFCFYEDREQIIEFSQICGFSTIYFFSALIILTGRFTSQRALVFSAKSKYLFASLPLPFCMASSAASLNKSAASV